MSRIKTVKYHYIFLLLILIVTQSCFQGAVEIKSWLETNSTEEAHGTYHFLADDGIKIFLPEVFNKYPLIEYTKLLDSLATSKNEYQQEKKRLNYLRKLDGNFHIFFDGETRSTYTINTMPYMPLYKKDAQYLLGMIRLANEKSVENSDLEFTKITAKYNASSGPQVFKVVHRIDNKKTKDFSFNSAYIVSHNNKTIYIQLSSPYEAGFDPYLEKIIM